MRDLMWSHMQWRHYTALLIKHKEILSECAEIKLYKMFQLISRWKELKVNISCFASLLSSKNLEFTWWLF